MIAAPSKRRGTQRFAHGLGFYSSAYSDACSPSVKSRTCQLLSVANVIYFGLITHEKRFQRQQAIPAQQAMRRMRAQHELAQGLGKELGRRAVLLGRLPRQKARESEP